MIILQEPNLRKLNHGNFSLQTFCDIETADGKRWRIEAGFVTDFASSRVGRWNFLGVDAALSYPALFHDYLYKTGLVSKKQADLYFQEGLKSDSANVSWWDRWKGYWGVRVFGGFAWRNHRRNDPTPTEAGR